MEVTLRFNRELSPREIVHVECSFNSVFGRQFSQISANNQTVWCVVMIVLNQEDTNNLLQRWNQLPIAKKPSRFV